MFDELNIPINCDNIMKAIDDLHHSNSSGTDRISNQFIISGKNVKCMHFIQYYFLCPVTFPKHGSMIVLHHYTKRGTLIMLIITEVSPY